MKKEKNSNSKKIVSLFQKFLADSRNFSLEQKKEISTKVSTQKFKTILTLSFIFLIWSIIVVFIDKLLFLVLSYHITIGLMESTTVPSKAFIPIVSFLFINALAKFLYIQKYSKIPLPFFIKLKAVIPYFGSFFLIYAITKNDTLLTKALLQFLKSKKTIESAKSRISNVFFKKKHI